MYKKGGKEMNITYRKEMAKLAEGLAFRGIPFQFKPLFDGSQIIVNGGEWDVICHSGSYGGDNGLLEVMGDCMLSEELKGDVEGWLTAEEILNRL